MIKIEHLNKVYQENTSHIYALNDINLEVKTGEIFGIIGQSGAGKSTLIRCVNLLEKPSTGNVKLDGIELTSLSVKQLRETRRQLGMIFQHFNLLSNRTVYQNIIFPLQLTGMRKKEIDEAVMPLIELTGLNNKINSYPDQLSGGQKQRVAIARALANKPKLLLSDEATSALDPHTTSSILELLSNINKQLGLTILLITHEMDVIKSICDRVALLDNGQILEQSPVVDFFVHPRTTIAKQLTLACLKQELPDSLKHIIKPATHKQGNPLIRVSFHGHVTSKPIINQLIQTYHVEINILQANMEYIKQEPIGVMLIELKRDKGDIEQALAFMKSEGIRTEVIAYVD